MTLPIRTKQPSEERLFDMDFGAVLRDGGELASVISAVAINQGNVDGSAELTVGSKSYSGEIAQVWLSGGTDLEDYQITIKVTTVAGETLEGDGMLQVREL